MNINPKIQQNLQLKKKALSLLSTAIAKILLKFRLPRGEFINLLDEKLVLEAKKQDPDASNVALAIRTGIDRRYISKHLKGEMPNSRPDKLTVILEDIRWTAQKFYNSNKIPKMGPFRTFQSICGQRASGSLTYKAILEELISNGNLKDLGSKVELIRLRGTTKKDNINYSQTTANQINRIVNTIIYNSDVELADDRFVQRTIFSTQINPNIFNELHKDLKIKVRDYDSQITNLFISYEEDVNVGTYPEYGFSFLEYKARNKS
ncbi:MAG: hypothetical protein JKX98_06100 [Alcanivoracaceae bacterium]|nr:hypothetical protein [Alcanivoracaceae bacterium]